MVVNLAKGGKYPGKGVAGVGFGIGMYDDMANDDRKHLGRRCRIMV